MADLSKLRTHAPSNLTGELTHDRDIVPLAERFLPLIRFHHEERFHPVGLEGLVRIPRQEYRAVENSAAAEAMEISVDVADPSGVGTVSRSFPPPVLRTDTSGSPGHVVANDQDDTLAPFARPEIGRSSKLTHGPGFTWSNSIFGSEGTISNLQTPSEGEPRKPRHPIEVIAEFRMMWETLGHALEIVNLPDDEYPKADDSILAMTSLAWLFFERAESEEADTFSEPAKRDVLSAIISGSTPPDIPLGWKLRNDVVETARNAAILEYHLIYPYNDYDDYEPWPANHHEGDDEGFCYVFDRRDLEGPVVAGVPDEISDAVPKWVITSVHLETQQADRIKDFDSISQNEVFVARGSHATYLTPGSHDFLSAGNAFEEGANTPANWVGWLSAGSIPLLLGLAVVIAEHFRDSNDETAETGIAAGNQETTDPDLVDNPRFEPVELSVTPLSADENIYRPSNAATAEQDGLLGLASFAGSIGAHTNSLGRTSPRYKRKTDRFFRKLIGSGLRIS